MDHTTKLDCTLKETGAKAPQAAKVWRQTQSIARKGETKVKAQKIEVELSSSSAAGRCSGCLHDARGYNLLPVRCGIASFIRYDIGRFPQRYHIEEDASARQCKHGKIANEFPEWAFCP
jgi:hypothetical protein